MNIKTVINEKEEEVKILVSVDSREIKNGTFIIPEGINVIGDRAFYNCPELTTVIIPETVTKIENKAFTNCTNLINIQLPNNLTYIGDEAFKSCDHLENLIIPDNVIHIGKYCFGHCANLKNIQLSEKLKNIPEFVFYGCENLEEVVIPESISEIGDSAFSGCKSIKELYIPDDVERIGLAAFELCECLEKVRLPNSLKQIKDETFAACKNLSEIRLPQSIVTIGSDAFEGCEKIESITIPKNVSEICNVTFAGCSSLNEIRIDEGNDFFKAIDGVLFDKNAENLICYPIGKKQRVYEIPHTVKQIGDFAFAGAKFINQVIIPNSVTSIGDGAFKECTGISTAEIPESVVSLPEEVFSECTNLSSVTLNKGLIGIEWNAFYRCIKLSEINIPEGVINIGEKAFGSCTQLKKIQLPSSLVHIENNAFNTSISPDGSNVRAYYNNGYLVICEKEEKNRNGLTFPINFFTLFGSEREIKKFYENSDFRAFLSNFDNAYEILKRRSETDKIAFFKFAKVLGCFSKRKVIDDNDEETEATIGQKASALLAVLVKIPPFNTGVYGNLFESLSIFSEENQQFLDFISTKGACGFENLHMLMELESSYPGIFAKVMADFDEALSYRKTIGENGRPAKLNWKIALTRFYKNRNYMGVTEENQDIAKLFLSKSISQETLDKVSKLRQMAVETNIPEHILEEPLFEQNSEIPVEEGEGVKESIERIKRQTAMSLKKSTDLLEKIYKKRFLYEWLNKRDAHNPIIGLYCDCCAVIENNDYGRDISRASIIAPDVQNLVIRNVRNQIIAKAAVYVNSELGYAVVNNFEINEKYRKTELEDEPYGGRYSGDKKEEKDKTQKEKKEDESRQLIFDSFMRGIKDFVHRYNELHPEKPITQVNVGTGYNKLKKQIEMYEKATKKLTVPASYSFFDSMRYDQHILYKLDEKENDIER